MPFYSKSRYTQRDFPIEKGIYGLDLTFLFLLQGGSPPARPAVKFELDVAAVAADVCEAATARAGSARTRGLRKTRAASMRYKLVSELN